MPPRETTGPAPKASPQMSVILTAFQGLGYALSARSLLLLSIIGAFVLAVMSLQRETQASLWVLIAYGVLVVLPIVWLEIRRRG